MHGLSLLIVDDEQDFVATLARRVQKRGWFCEGVLSGAEAVEKIKQHEFDLVLLDMKLPDMDGNKVLQQIKKTRPHTQVVILSGHASAKAGEEGLLNGAYDYLMKPLEFESLFEKLIAASGKSPRGSPAGVD